MIFNDLLGVAAYVVVIAFILSVMLVKRGSLRARERNALLAIVAILLALMAWRIGGGDDWFREWMKSEFRQHHAYERRRNIQLVGLICAAVLGGTGMFLVWRRLAHVAIYLRQAALLAMALLGFGVVRASSLHQIDKIIYMGAGPVNLNRLIEAILLLGTGYCVWKFAGGGDTKTAARH